MIEKDYTKKENNIRIVKREKVVEVARERSVSTILIIVASIFTIFLFGILYVVFILMDTGVSVDVLTGNAQIEGDRYFLNKNYSASDPFITKNPNLNDILAGPIISSLDPGIGLKNAPIVMVLFSDFECDFCRKQEEVLKEIKNKYNDQLRIIWKDYPEPDYNSISFMAAHAARCAQEQDKFWEYHDFLFESNKNLNEDLFYAGAKELGMDLDLFENCLKDDEIKNKINDNIIEANALDIPGVPFLFINDQEIIGEVTSEELERIIESELIDNN